jgi:hypothetical protein
MNEGYHVMKPVIWGPSRHSWLHRTVDPGTCQTTPASVIPTRLADRVHGTHLYFPHLTLRTPRTGFLVMPLSPSSIWGHARYLCACYTLEAYPIAVHRSLVGEYIYQKLISCKIGDNSRTKNLTDTKG